MDRRLLALLFAPLLLAACGKDESYRPSPAGVRLEAWPLRLHPGQSAQVSLRISDPSPDLPTISWSVDGGTIAETAVANEISYTAPEAPRSCTLGVSVSIQDRSYRDSVFFTVTGAAEPPQGLSFPLAAAAGAALSSEPGILFSDGSPLYSSPGSSGKAGATDVIFRTSSLLSGESWLHVSRGDGTDARRAMADLGGDGTFHWYGAELPGDVPGAEYWFELSALGGSLYCSPLGVQSLPPAPGSRFALSAPAAEPPTRAVLSALRAFLYGTGDPSLRGDGKRLGSSLLAAYLGVRAVGGTALPVLVPGDLRDPAARPKAAKGAMGDVPASATILAAVLPCQGQDSRPSPAARPLPDSSPAEELSADLSTLRRSLSSLSRGSWLPIAPGTGGSFALARWDGSSRVLAIVNVAQARTIEVPAGALGFGDGDRLKIALSCGASGLQAAGQSVTVRDGSVRVFVPDSGGVVLVGSGADTPSPLPARRPRMTSIYPTDGARAIPTDTRVILQFSQEMDQEGIARAFSIVPPAEGRFVWNRRICTFVPASPLEPATTYRVSVDRSLGSAQGGYMMDDGRTFSFSTR